MTRHRLRSVAIAWWARCLLVIGCAACASRDKLPPPLMPLVVTEDAEFRKHPPKPALETGTPVLDVPALETATLANGLKLWVASRPTLPHVALSLAFRGAGTSTSCKAPEVLTLTARLLAEGGLTWTDGTIVEPPQVGGRKVSFDVDATHTEFNLLARRSALGGALEVLTRTARYPALGRGVQLDVVRLAEAKSLQNASAGVGRILLELAAASSLGAPVAEQLVPLGVKTVADTSLEDILACYAEAFAPESAALIAVGDVTLEELRARVEPLLGGWTPVKVQHARATTMDPAWQAEGKHVHLVWSGNMFQANVLVLQPAPPSSQTHDALAFAVLAEAAVGSFTSRANMRLRHDSGLTYGVRPWFIQTPNLGLMAIGAAFPIGQVGDAVNELLATLDGFRRKAMSDDELRASKRGFIADLQRRLDGNASTASFLAQAFADGRAPEALARLPQELLEITAQDVQRVALTYLDPENVDIAVAGRPSLDRELGFVGRVVRYSVK